MVVMTHVCCDDGDADVGDVGDGGVDVGDGGGVDGGWMGGERWCGTQRKSCC